MIKTFDDVLKIKNGKNQKTVENPKGKYPIYGSGGIMGYADDFICQAKTVVVGRKGSINNPLYVEEPFWNVDTAFGLESNQEILLPKYLFYFCKNFDFERLNKAVTIPSLTKSDLLQIKIDVPNIEEQEHVVKKLEAIENIILTRKQQLLKIDTLIKARFVEMFGDIFNNYFDQKALGEIANISSSKRIFASEYVNEGIPFYRSKEIRELGCGEKPSIELFITEEKYTEIKSKYGIPQKGDILIAAIGATIGYMWVIDTDKPFYYKDGNLILISKLENGNPVFFQEILKRLIDDYKNKGAAGTAQLALTIEKVEKMRVPVPPIELQNNFAAFVESVDKLKVVIQKELDKTQLLFDSLMQEYFG